MIVDTVVKSTTALRLETHRTGLSWAADLTMSIGARSKAVDLLSGDFALAHSVAQR